MLSILIPVYNIEITNLVRELDAQAKMLSMPFEIICFDDDSEEVWKKRNAPVKEIRHVVYRELPSNMGRSKIRNLLAFEAQYPMLLFLDSDSKIIREDFLLKYTEAFDEMTVVVGGRLYPSECPGKDYELHWKYGSLIEQKAISGFQSNNFLIPVSIIKANPFDESIMRYGHEDTLFGHQLSRTGVNILRIENPVLHDRLETNTDFLQNQTDAIKNLLRLKASHPEIETRLTLLIKQLDDYRLSVLLTLLFGLSQNLIVSNLKGKNPSLNLLHFFKIGLYLLERAAIQKEKRPS